MTALMRTALLNHLPGFFDHDPLPVLALRLEHAQALRWTVTDAALEVTVGTNPALTFPLRSSTLTTLAQAITAQGVTVTLNADCATWPATRLIPSQGLQGQSGSPYGAGGYASTAILWAHAQALGQALDDAQQALTAALQQLILPTTQEGWLDEWGGWFSVVRRAGETDADYRTRIVDELYRPRSNAVAMIRNVARYTGATIELFEPWTQTFILSQSRLSDVDHLPDAYYSYHVLHPLAETAVDWATIMPILDADRPAGTVILDPSNRQPPFQSSGLLSLLADEVDASINLSLPTFYINPYFWIVT